MKAYKKTLTTGNAVYHLVTDNGLLYSANNTSITSCQDVSVFTTLNEEYHKANGFIECPVEEAQKVIRRNLRTISKNIK